MKIDRKKFEALYELLTFVESNNWFYKERIKMRELVGVNNLSSLLNKIPIVTKQNIMQNETKYLSILEEDFFQELTSGTTGIPFKCYKTKKERMLLAMAEWKERRLWDKDVIPSRFFQLMGVNEKYGIDFSDFSDENIKKIFNLIKNENASWICGSPTTLYNYAKKIELNVVKPISSVKYIELQGEYADKAVRSVIEKNFGCRTIMHYGNRECWAIAYECKCGKMHVMDNIILENYLDDSGNNLLIVTNLYARKMPFIRYCTNDIGLVKEEICDCGKKTPVVYLEGGRRANIIVGYDIIGDIAFKKIIHNVINKSRIKFDIIRRYRIEQTKKDTFVYYIDKGVDFKESYCNEIIEETRKLLGEKVKIHIVEEYCDINGKYRIFKPLKT